MIKVKIIEQYLKEHSMSKKAFAEKCGISANTLRRIMKGEGLEKVETMLKIREVIGVSVNKLLLSED